MVLVWGFNFFSEFGFLWFFIFDSQLWLWYFCVFIVGFVVDWFVFIFRLYRFFCFVFRFQSSISKGFFFVIFECSQGRGSCVQGRRVRRGCFIYIFESFFDFVLGLEFRVEVLFVYVFVLFFLFFEMDEECLFVFVSRRDFVQFFR